MSSPVTSTRRRRPRGRTVLAVLLALVAIAAVYGFYRHLNRNIVSYDLPGDVQGSGGATPLDGLPDGVAQNIVVIGTDSRQSDENCKLGGSCKGTKLDGDTNADVTMLVHISADHSSISVVSIPRDTMLEVDACSGNGKTLEAGRVQFNQTLNYGTDCTMRAVHKLTGLPINHFAMVDFSGVIDLSNAVGGVQVCVDDNVYDSYSHLKLKKGTHTLQGESALQFLRTRHGFGDGSDLGRTVAQHIFLSSLQRKLESAGTLLNPQKVYRLAEAGTQALTVDTGLANVSTLAQVAVTVGRIPASATTFVTMPTVTDPLDANRVVPAERAQQIWDRLAADRPLVDKATTKSATPTATGTSSASDSASPSATSASPTAEQTASSAAASSTPTGDPAHDGTAQVSSENTGCAKVSQVASEMKINGETRSLTPAEAYAATPEIADSAS